MHPQAATGDQVTTGPTPKRNPILDLPLDQVIKSEYALPLQRILGLYTVSNLLGAWRDPQSQKDIEDLFDYPEQAHHAVSACAAWLGFGTVAAPGPVEAWWQGE
jgi:hypothetical protein